ncbi:polysaccharide pyruvyl transferase family protein [Sandarakinorhabdus sp.]|uniref:polysaccharide pyruvyl transferase family protein n=1 Tax=Sandarakinorhabdus sp. TaxID=1916663 RepID=UPI003F71D3B5
MTRIQLRGLPSLDNYGTAMMGLVTIAGLAKRIPGPVQFDVVLHKETDIAEILRETGIDNGPDSGRVRIERANIAKRPRLATPAGLLLRLRELIGSKAKRDFDLLVVLGGDDISEYYRPNIWRYIALYWVRARSAPVALLAQTIGPFALLPNRLAARFLMPALRIVPRDRWTTRYLADEFGLKRNVVQGSDLAYADLPLQHDTAIAAETLTRYGLEADTYATVVVSGMQKDGYYTRDAAAYYQRWSEIVQALLALPAMAGKRICLLAHTFGIYGDEGVNIARVLDLLPPEARARVVPVTDRILATRARFVLGGGLFTVTGRMHPAVSTFQMGKPAITLAYSKKYEGVIGTMLGRSDLIIDANHPELWAGRAIVDLVADKAADALARHDALCAEIRAAIAEQKVMVAASLDDLAALVR